MKYGLAVFPAIYDSFYATSKQLLFSQRLEPSVLYVAPQHAEVEFIKDNMPHADVDAYLCSVYTRGWQEFKAFAQRVGRQRIVAGGYHPTAKPHDALKYASKVVTGYCGNIDDILLQRQEGIYQGSFAFTPMRRDLIDQTSLCQVYPDISPHYTVGSMVSSVGCPFDCDFCSTPQMSGRKMKVSSLDYVDQEIADLLSRGVDTVFVRDESFATNPFLREISARFRNKFSMVYSFGTGNVMGIREDVVKHLAQNGWHSLNFGLEDVGVGYRKNKLLKQACENCRRHGIQVVLSFIVNDDGKSIAEATANYRALYDAFCDLKPSQVCANFLMPMPGSGLWSQYKNRIAENDFSKYDSKTPILCAPELVEWHKRMIVAVQLAYYYSDVYQKEVRKFECGDTLHLRARELQKEYDLTSRDWGDLLDLPSSAHLSKYTRSRPVYSKVPDILAA
jgi:radical SAM superfamily enzyme YgiQ (UPF0313 family)